METVRGKGGRDEGVGEDGERSRSIPAYDLDVERELQSSPGTLLDPSSVDTPSFENDFGMDRKNLRL